ncbi:MAG: cytochrome C [Candidatus Dadabacteria bacterium]|nr:cytochrome C [Candidatus Dadabacteria bacterium]NIV41197.1 cytochrome C [Candidatus Dadabacteria bacterium]NIX14486.1 cytochrome C [Candidatus Dadabacteria bacterium]
MNENELILGPRIPNELWQKERERFLIPTILMVTAAVLLLISIFLPYWKLTLFAPQYPGGLKAQLYVNRAAGDIEELDILNHYIGMKSMKEAAPLERTLSIALIVGVVLLTVAAIYVHSPVAVFLTIPAILFPAFFLGDLYYWLRNFGTNLDPNAPLNSVEPFVPPLIGDSTIAQFKTTAQWEIGLYLSIIASILIIAGLYFHRKAYKPLIEARIKNE